MSAAGGTSVRWPRRLAAAAVITAATGLGVLAFVGWWGFALRAFVFHIGIVAIGLGTLVWVVLPSQPRNRAVGALLLSASFAGLFVASLAIAVLMGRASFPGITGDEFYALSPAELPLPVALVIHPSIWTWVPAYMIPVTFGLLLFPDGRVPTPGWRWVGWLCAGTIAVGAIGLAIVGNPWSTEPIGAGDSGYGGVLGVVTETAVALISLGTLLGGVSLVVRYQRSSGVVRRQIRWIVWGGTFLAVVALVGWFLPIGDGADGGSLSGLVLLAGVAVWIFSFAVAITKHRLYEIDLVISRTVAYLTLAVVIGALYVAAVFGLVALFGDPDQAVADLGVEFWFGATALVAIVFEPLRLSLQRVANRMVYGPRAAPHEVLSQLTSMLSDMSRGAGLAGLAQLLCEGTGAEGAVVWLRVGDRLRVEATAPPEAAMGPSDVAIDADLPASESELAVPVHHGGELLGALGITKSRSHPVTPADETLLADVAAGAGLLLRNLRLNAELATRAAELQASRRRLIAAHDAARHRLERDLHDGAQQQVVALKVRLGIAQTIAEREGAPDLASRVASLADGTQQAVDAMRAVARGIYPPLLDAEGLGPALGTLRRSVDLSLEIELGSLPRYSREVEETAYFCVAAAVDQARMAGAAAAKLVVRGDDASLTLTVTYDSLADLVDLPALTDRVDAFGGTIATEKATGETTLTLFLPVAAHVMEPM